MQMGANAPAGNGTSDDLVINNIWTNAPSMEGVGANAGSVLAYNYGRDAFTAYAENSMYEHNAGSSFWLYEGNQVGQITDDATHGTHNLNTWFRNYISGYDLPYVGGTPNARAVTANDWARFENAVGNAFGGPLVTVYQSSGSGFGYVYNLGNSPGSDPLVAATMMRWGNCDTATNTCRFQRSEVPTSLSGNAVPFQNAVPANHNLPCSFFLAGYSSTTCSSHPNGGTGLSWWKVCTSWTTFPTSCATSQTQPFPAVGPDVTGGDYVNGTAYDIPAAVAFKTLPIDPTYQTSYRITGSSWSNGIETLTVSGLPTGHLMGGFQITGLPACNNPAVGDFLMTNSTPTTISYALASDPGSCSGGTVKFPDIRQFDERVYENDAAGGIPAPPSGLTAIVN
jgi:hypothetical protein